MSTPRAFNNHAARELRQRYEEGKTLAQLKADYGGSERSISRAIKRVGGRLRDSHERPGPPRPRRKPDPSEMSAMAQARLAKGLTQKQVAEAVGTEATHYSRVEKGTRGASDALLGRIRAYLGMDETVIDQVQQEVDETSDEAISTILHQSGLMGGLLGSSLMREARASVALDGETQSYEIQGFLKEPGDLLDLPSNAELAERAQGMGAFAVVRNWLERHIRAVHDMPEEEWLTWLASNFLIDPEVGAHLVPVDNIQTKVMLAREGTELETVHEIAEYIRYEASKHALSPRLALEQIAERIESGQWHRYRTQVGVGTNPELWR